jgi:hypothetical protein
LGFDISSDDDQYVVGAPSRMYVEQIRGFVPKYCTKIVFGWTACDLLTLYRMEVTIPVERAVRIEWR